MPVLRRNILAGLAGACALPWSGLDPAYARAVADAAGRAPVSRLWMKREQTGEQVSAIVRGPAGYHAPDHHMLSWLMRDVQDGNAAVWIDPRLFDLLADIQGAMSAVHGSVVPLVITSGYRTPDHNSRLEGAARASLHLNGCAADLKVPGYDSRALAFAGALYARGGVGVYPTFCHLDTGAVRAWAGGDKPAGGKPVTGTPLPSAQKSQTP